MYFNVKILMNFTLCHVNNDFIENIRPTNTYCKNDKKLFDRYNLFVSLVYVQILSAVFSIYFLYVYIVSCSHHIFDRSNF